MKRLTLVRHAKSSWKFPDLHDRDRPLNHRGQGDLPRMAKRYAKLWTPDILISSPARRALTTAEGFAAQLQIDPQEIVVDEKVYPASPSHLIELIRDQDDRFQHIALFCHNPSITELSNFLCDSSIENVPTCGIVVIAFSIENWRMLTTTHVGQGELLAFDYPKKNGKH